MAKWNLIVDVALEVGLRHLPRRRGQTGPRSDVFGRRRLGTRPVQACVRLLRPGEAHLLAEVSQEGLLLSVLHRPLGRHPLGRECQPCRKASGRGQAAQKAEASDETAPSLRALRPLVSPRRALQLAHPSRGQSLLSHPGGFRAHFRDLLRCRQPLPCFGGPGEAGGEDQEISSGGRTASGPCGRTHELVCHGPVLRAEFGDVPRTQMGGIVGGLQRSAGDKAVGAQASASRSSEDPTIAPDRWRSGSIRYRYDDDMGNTHQGRSGYLSSAEASRWRVGDRCDIRVDRERPARRVWMGAVAGVSEPQ